MKAALRASALGKRGALATPSAGEALARVVLAGCPPPPGVVVAGFHPMRDEIDVLPLLHSLHSEGHPLALPVTPPRGQPLRFRPWTPGAVLVPGRFGTSHPEGEEEIVPDWLIIPLLAFDARGHRLGYGGGYYDRTLAAMPGVFRLGVAYAGQQVTQVPTCPTDVPMHVIATELGLVRP